MYKWVFCLYKKKNEYINKEADIYNMYNYFDCFTNQITDENFIAIIDNIVFN